MDPVPIIHYRSPLDPSGSPPDSGRAVPPILTIAILLAVVLGAGVYAVSRLRAWLRRPGDDHGDWEKTLVDWRNLRDEGVLTEEEYRKVRTLVEPLTRIGTPDPGTRHQPASGRSGPDHERT